MFESCHDSFIVSWVFCPVVIISVKISIFRQSQQIEQYNFVEKIIREKLEEGCIIFPIHFYKIYTMLAIYGIKQLGLLFNDCRMSGVFYALLKRHDCYAWPWIPGLSACKKQ